MIIFVFCILHPALFLSLVISTPDIAEAKTSNSNPPLSRPKIGLVLGGGGARGIAHVGVIKVLEKNHIPIDYIVGTSMGAIIGGLYASGYSAEELKTIVQKIDWEEIFRDLPSEKYLSFNDKGKRTKLIDFKLGLKEKGIILPKGLIAGQKLGYELQLLTLHVSNISHFDELPIPFRCIATDIETGEEIILEKGNLADALRASMSVPGIFSPVTIKNRVLVDGGAVKNLPIDVAKSLGADIVIAVDVGAPLLKQDELESLLDITQQILNIMIRQNVSAQQKLLTEKDILIKPDLGQISSLDFTRAKEIINLGETSALDIEEKIQKYSVSTATYKDFLKRQRKDTEKLPRIDFITVQPTPSIPIQRISNKIRTPAGEKLNITTLSDDLKRIYSLGAFERVDFKLTEHNEQKGIVIEPKEKTWDKSQLRFGLNIDDDFEGNGFYSFIVNHRLTRINKVGAEWENELQIGNVQRFFSQFYQPLDYTDRFFIRPQFEFKRQLLNVYEGNFSTGQFRSTGLTGQLNIGTNFSTYAQLWFGIKRGQVDLKPIFGGTDNPTKSVDKASLIGNLEINTIDNPNFPRSGTIGHITKAKIISSIPDITVL